MAVTDPLIGTHDFKVRDLGLESKAGLDGAEGRRRVGRQVAEGEDARADHVVVGCGEVGDPSGVSEVVEELFGLEGGVLGQVVEKVDLGEGCGIRGLIRGSEVGVDASDVEVGVVLEFVKEVDGGVWAHAGALHAGVYFEMNADRLLEGLTSGGDEIGFIGGADGEFKIEVDEIGDLIFMDGAKDKDGSCDAGGAEEDALLKTRDAEIIDAGVERSLSHLAKAVAVGVRFYRKTEEA
jgi:hypothetical protein